MENYVPQNAHEIIEIFLKRKKLFLVPFFSVLGLTVLVYPFLPKVYESSAMVLVEENRMINPLIEGLAVKQNLEKTLQTLSAQALSWKSMTQMVNQLKLADNIVDQRAFEALILSISKRISFKMMSEKIIRISYQDKDPKVAQTITNAITENLVGNNRKDKQEEAQNAINFIDEQLRIYKDKLQNSEGTFFLNKVNTDLNEAQKTRASVADQIAQLEKTVVTSVVEQKNPATQEMRKDLLQSESLLRQMAADSKESNPMVQSLQEKVESLRKRIRYEEEGQMGSETKSTNPEYQEALRKLKELDLTVDSLVKKKADLQEGRSIRNRVTDQELLAMERDKHVNEDIYQSLLRKLENAHISQRLDAMESGRTLEIVDPAHLPLQNVKPKRSFVLLAGLGLALLAGGGAIFLREYFDTSFRGVVDAKSYLKIPLLAASPKLYTPEAEKNLFAADAAPPPRWLAALKRRKLWKQWEEFSRRPQFFVPEVLKDPGVSPMIVALHAPDSVPGELYRVLRTHVFFMNSDRPPKTVMFTSAMEGDGKTTTSINLAISLAQELDYKVLLMDCDLRRGNVAKYLGLPQENGVAEFLAAQGAGEPVLKKGPGGRLTVLTSGKTIPNPSRLFMMAPMRKLMDDLRARFDFIIMDAPPVINLSDVPVLTSHAEGVVLAAKAGGTPRELVRNAVTMIEESKSTRVMGCVLTQVEHYLPEYFQRYIGGGYYY